MDTPTTLLEAVRYFSDLDNCERSMRNARWPGGKPCCPECQSTKQRRRSAEWLLYRI